MRVKTRFRATGDPKGELEGESVKNAASPLNQGEKRKKKPMSPRTVKFRFWKCTNRTVLPAPSKRCRWSTRDGTRTRTCSEQPVQTRKSFQMSERKAVIKNADMSEVRVRRVTRYRAVSVASARGNGMRLRALLFPPGNPRPPSGDRPERGPRPTAGRGAHRFHPTPPPLRE